MITDPFARLSQGNIMAAVQHATALQSAGRLAEAAALWTRIAAVAPTSAEVRFNLGAALLGLERHEVAEQALRDAVRLKPGMTAAVHRLGNLLQATGRWDEAERLYDEALRQDPSLWRAKLDLAHIHLGRGDFTQAWPLFEARRDLGGAHIDAPPFPREWRGEPLDGRSILIWPEQGFGDQIQFARFAPDLAKRGADVTLVAPPELSALFATLGVRVVERSAQMALAQPDYWTWLQSIPGRIGVTMATLPAAPYLSTPQDRKTKWGGFAQTGGVGVMWQGRATPNPHRSLPAFEILQPLADAGAQLVELTPPPGGDFADVAAQMERLDLIISVDTAAAHLAGALGKPVWILLPWFNADWRWMQGRAHSPWYPTARLFRQPSHGDWAGVVADLVAAWTCRA
ncbi:tetratricopeptide repeat protein [Phenylobacterium sp. J426]|uniref:tetratricopeptide repeat protein n=1 Tax=Phenylobacterium sp. J426 TaxID=2898439 RepID=UPI0021516898|nr:tetratricopeptide repeat protein [Phenylobacterium sp. J426]MCR5875740.1 tetratricopeptide repeat protein [Phenylobacterium sp. J426]